ncbi:TWiK family of potassium channels protein 7-like isoform X2 [Anneissia japonica]|uniref:TWiK family of potassium channels protein 7-like isoform X2 n=1 Tax=Anneissia japonica TaxID=1529436 RepID=UPI00142596B5|nr:TWiK family of potassium channels protein 7-like isoform X2 [Anneissia japonica]
MASEHEEDYSVLKHPLCRSAIKYAIVNTGLFVVTCLYAVMGAAVFKSIEGPVEKEAHETFVDMKKIRRDDLINILTDPATITSRDALTEMLDSYEKDIEEISGCTLLPEAQFEPEWTFTGSLFFSVVVMTTIGYGNIAPVTVAGRTFCMFYAVFGIALLLLVLASIGSLLARGATMSYRYFKVFMKKDSGGNKRREKEFVREVPAPIPLEGTSRNAVVGVGDNGMVVTRINPDVSGKDKQISPFFDPSVDYGRAIDPEDPTKLHQVTLKEDGEGEERMKTPDIQGVDENEQKKHNSLDEIFGDEEAGTNIPLTAILLFAFVYMCLLAALLTSWEQWNYFEALYFSFITLTTIGFGDLVPKHQKNLLACVFLIMVGMAVMSMCIALAQEEIMSKVRQIGKLIGVIITKRKRSKREK